MSTAKDSKRLVFVYNSIIPALRCNVDKALEYLKRLQELGIVVEIIDTKELSDSDRWKLYSDAIVGSMVQKAAIRRVFGSNRDPGFMFGKQVPALLVKDDHICMDIYPQIRSIVDGEYHSIESYLQASGNA